MNHEGELGQHPDEEPGGRPVLHRRRRLRQGRVREHHLELVSHSAELHRLLHLHEHPVDDLSAVRPPRAGPHDLDLHRHLHRLRHRKLPLTTQVILSLIIFGEFSTFFKRRAERLELECAEKRKKLREEELKKQRRAEAVAQAEAAKKGLA